MKSLLPLAGKRVSTGVRYPPLALGALLRLHTRVVVSQCFFTLLCRY